MVDSTDRSSLARRVFNGIAEDYEGPARVFSLFQHDRWRRFLVSRLRLPPQALVLDVGTGTALVAIDVARTIGCRAVGVDLAASMIEQGQRNLEAQSPVQPVSLLRGCAQSLPLGDHSFDGVVFTFLLRYVEDPQATLRELARVLRPGGQMVSLEFFIPQNPVLHGLWLLHTRLVLSLGTRFLSPGWREVGSFLGRSISAFYREHTLDDLSRMWSRAGIGNVQTRVLSFGGAVVTWGQKEVRGES